MSERVLHDTNSPILHEWIAGRFCFRAIGGRVPRLERGGAYGSVRVFAGVTVCNDSSTVNELARLAAENAKLRKCVEAADTFLQCPNPECCREGCREGYVIARAEVDKP